MLRNFSDKLTTSDDKGEFELNCLMMIIEDKARHQWAVRLKITKKYNDSNARTTLLEKFEKDMAREIDAQRFVLDELEGYPEFRSKVLAGFQL
ncbi:hypothetical protein H9Q10_03320 [Eikenella sp. S3360]|uniref:Uncharacterized protein n=1 Tax=Eikenella glucosivorans TaxID=2766967 RepID=A0ABS0N8R4_9NEIS|nr:hypothetical protein [Eikenella glucosivorans]MBH5328698.1 hypothetical protein [Eikenella glucosivorans]